MRNKILEILDALINNNAENKFINLLRIAKSELKLMPSLSLDSMAYSPFVSMIDDKEIQTDREALIKIKQQILGELPHWHSYALKSQLYLMLPNKWNELYKDLETIIKLIQQLRIDKSEGDLNEFKRLRANIFNMCYKELVFNTVPEYLVSYVCNIILKLPYNLPETFDLLQSRYNLLNPSSSEEHLSTQVKHVEDMLKKLQGETTLFVDIFITPKDYLINLR